jgi:hypothetical protein
MTGTTPQLTASTGIEHVGCENLHKFAGATTHTPDPDVALSKP